MKTVTGVFTSMIDLERAARELEGMGVPHRAVGVIAGNDENRHREYLKESRHTSRTTATAAASGASTGGGIGIAVSLIALAIPGVGPMVAGSALATLVMGLGIGALGGALLGAIHNMAIPHEQAPLLEEAVRRGELLLAAEVDDPIEHQASAVMSANGARSVEDVADTWRTAGWSGPKSDPHPYVFDSTVRSHAAPGS